MDEQDWLAEQFEVNRTHLRAVAYRILGSLSDADDAVQEAWLRFSRSKTSGIENLGGWQTAVLCLARYAGRLLWPSRHSPSPGVPGSHERCS